MSLLGAKRTLRGHWGNGEPRPRAAASAMRRLSSRLLRSKRAKKDCSDIHAGPLGHPTKAVASSPRDTSDTRLGGIIMEARSTFSSTKTPVRKRRRHPLSPIIKRSINLAGHDTSVTLEGEFWNALQDIARSKRVSIPVLIDQIDKDRSGSNLSSSVRLFVLEYFKALSQLRRAT